MISRSAVIAGGVGGLVLAFAALTIINALWILPAARIEGAQPWQSDSRIPEHLSISAVPNMPPCIECGIFIT